MVSDSGHEGRRLQALRQLAVLDTLPEPVFDAITAAAAQVCEVPIALLSLIDLERQWFKSNHGLEGVAGTPREVAFCDHAIRGEALFEVADAAADARFASNPLVRAEPHIRFYAGMPITMPGGERIGTVCVIDRRPRTLTDAQRATLQSLGRIAAACLLERRKSLATTEALADSEWRYRAIVEDQTEMISLARRDGVLTFVNVAYARHFGRTPEQMVGRDLIEFVDEADRPAVRAHLEAVCRDGRVSTGVNRMKAASGPVTWVAWSNRPVRDARGEVVALQSVGRDITEQRLAEEALAESERRYRALYETTPAILHSIDAAGMLLTASDLWLAVFGYTRAEVIGRPLTDFLDVESARRARDEVLPAFFRTGRCDRIEYRFLCRDGTPVDVLLSARLERDEAGAPFRSLAVLEDITERKRIAAELGRTHAQLDAIVENVPALLGRWDRDGVTRFANREYQAAVGLPMEAIIGHPLREVHDRIDPASTAALWSRAEQVLRGRRQDFELAMITTSGLRLLRVTLVPDQPEHGVIAGFFGMAYDLTGRKALELRLADSEARYRSLFEHLNSGFALHQIVVDEVGRPADYVFLAMNAAFGRMTGLVPVDAIGRRITELLPDIRSDSTDWIDLYGRVALEGEPRHFEQHSVLVDRWFEIVAYRPAAGQFAVILRDITQRKQAEAGLQAALREKETLLKEVYHRVKNNLQVVQGLLELQRDGLEGGPARDALDDSVQRVQAMSLVHEKLYRSGNPSAVELADYLPDLMQQIGEMNGAPQRRIVLSASVAPLRTALDHAIPLGLLVAELVGNALKHAFAGRADGAVQVRLVAEEGGARLQVADDGIGLPAGFHLHQAGSLGVQLAVNLARQLGGELAATSGPGGTTFEARLTVF